MACATRTGNSASPLSRVARLKTSFMLANGTGVLGAIAVEVQVLAGEQPVERASAFLGLEQARQRARARRGGKKTGCGGTFTLDPPLGPSR